MFEGTLHPAFFWWLHNCTLHVTILIYSNNFMKIFKLCIPILLVLAGCKKKDIGSASSTTKSQGYIVVNCDNCKVDYGMPDQYREFNVVTTSPKATFSYTPGYILQIYVTALDHQQKVTLNVYNSAGTSVYNNSATQPLTGYWSSSVLLN